jgi:hypothetical protein
MRVVGPAMVVVIAVAGAAVGAPRPKDKVKDERTPVDPPSGEWWVEKIEDDGRVLHKKGPREVDQTTRFTSEQMVLFVRGFPIADRRVAYFQNGTVFEMDLSPGDPKTMRKGIWKIDEDVMLLCYGAPGGDRPTDFTAPKDSGRMLWTLKRK